MDSPVTPNEEPEGLNHWQYGDDIFPLTAHSRLLNTWKLLEAWLRILQLLAFLGVLAWSMLLLPELLRSVHTAKLHRHTPALTNLHMAANGNEGNTNTEVVRVSGTMQNLEPEASAEE